MRQVRATLHYKRYIQDADSMQSTKSSVLRAIIGIDPGKQGGIAVLDQHGKIVLLEPMPIAGKDIDLGNLADTIYNMYSKYDVEAYIEKVGAMPGQGVTSMFTFGFGTGAVHGILAAFKVPRYLVTPQAWKKVILAGTSKDKEAAIEYCRRAYPTIDLKATKLSKKPHSGMADAICIALYGHQVKG